MLLEQETELLTTTEYENYLDSGGKLPEQEYHLVCLIISQPDRLRFNGRTSRHQMSSILEVCGLQTTMIEMLAYDTLRERMSCEDMTSNDLDDRCRNVWCMGDQELAREVVFLTDETGEKYRIITERYPNIFGE
jgi:hypothetical protein